jgi:tetratricopeptide (TPR) repeat protein
MGLCAQQSGDRSRAVQLFEEAAQRGGALLWVKAAALNNAGMALLEEGRYTEAESPLQEGLRANEESDEGRGDRRGIAHSHASLGELCYRLARFEEAQQWLEHTRAEAREIEDGHCEQQAVAMLVRVLVLKNQTREAEQLSANLALMLCAEDPELAALCRLARLEVACAGEAPPRSDLLPSTHVGASVEGPALPGAGALNAQVEALYAALECALRHRDAAVSRQLAAALAQHLPLAVDACLRRYGEWLLGAGLAPGGTSLAPLPGELSGTVFAARANRLAEALRALSSD